MKNLYIKLMLIVFVFSGFLNNAKAQDLVPGTPPEGIIYQAEARDNRGAILGNKDLEVKITILEDNANGVAVWEGLHQVTTNTYGMFVLLIGEGTSSYDFAAIEWRNYAHFLNVQVKTIKGKDALIWVDMGTTQLLSVPYALHAKTATEALTADYNSLYNAPTTIDDADADPTNEIELPTGGTAGQVLTTDGAGNYSWTTITGGNTGVECKDYDGNYYRTVTIGNQVWMAENLKTTNYADGTSISGVYAYNNEEDSVLIYGRLYSWAAVMNGDVSSGTNPSGVQGTCPTGWHIPSDAEWTELSDFLAANGHSGTEGTALKSTSGWDTGGNGTDDYGFSALPGGYRNSDSNFDYTVYYGLWWSATEYSPSRAWYRYMDYHSTGVNPDNSDKGNGFSVRCVRD